MAASHQSFWLRRARREAWRFNTGWWVELFLPWVVGLGVAFSVGILALRTAGVDPRLAAIPAAAVALLGAVTALVRARPKFLSADEALVRLDADLGLRNRLTSAREGVGEWPAPREDAVLALRWKWPVLLRPPAAALALGCAALLVPLPESAAPVAKAVAEPPGWTATQQQLDALRREELVQPEAVEQFQSALDALRKQPSDQWFRHESLEAGDNLQMQLGQSLTDLQKNLEMSLGALEAAREIEESQLQALGQDLDQALKESLQGMEIGRLPLDEKLLSQLKNLDVSQCRQLSAEEWKALSERLKAGIGTCSGGLSDGGDAGDRLLALILDQQGGGKIGRGPGTAPLTLDGQEPRLNSTSLESVRNEDLSHAALGDVVGLGKGEHKVDKNADSGLQSGGAMSTAGSGSEAVWQQTATPAEQSALRRFFQ
jgi:hypothetical protein